MLHDLDTLPDLITKMQYLVITVFAGTGFKNLALAVNHSNRRVLIRIRQWGILHKIQ
jgi:hypothetical protein